MVSNLSKIGMRNSCWYRYFNSYF